MCREVYVNYQVYHIFDEILKTFTCADPNRQFLFMQEKANRIATIGLMEKYKRLFEKGVFQEDYSKYEFEVITLPFQLDLCLATPITIAEEMSPSYWGPPKEDIDDVDNDHAQDVLLDLTESVALSMGMEYCEDVASQKQRELLELANESISMLDEDGYIQFEKSITLKKETYPEYDWIDGIQLIDDSIVVWLSTENSEDIFSSDIELFDEHTIDEMKSALQYTIKHLLKKS